MIDKSPSTPKFLDPKNTMYRDFHRSCDTVYRQLHSQGIGTSVSHAKIFSKDEEELFWSSGVFSISNPTSLQHAVFYFVGKHFCIRGGDEQRKLSPSQFLRTTDPDSYTYVEFGSKNRSGGFAQLNVDNKCVFCIAIPEARPKCLVYLLDTYMSKLPEFAFKKGVFYCRPKKKYLNEGTWYDSVAIGRNKLSNMVSEMCTEAGISRRTNHSLRATGESALFQSNVSESLIQKTTGHRSQKALQLYEHTSKEQTESVSRIMMGIANCDQVKENATLSKSESVHQVSIPQALPREVFGNLSNCKIGTISVNVFN